MGSVFFTELEAFASFAALLPRPLRETLLLERTDVPEVRSTVLVERLVVPVERLVEVPVLRLVRLFWSTEPVERLVVVPVLRLVRLFWSTEPAERLVVPVERLVELLPVERFVRSV
jgi:hypothetical protein